jgi:hypothetical protein
MQPSRKKTQLCAGPDSGAVFVEAALSIPLLLTILFVGCDLLRVSALLNAGQIAVLDAARWASFGEVLEGSNSRAESLKRQVVILAGHLGLQSDVSQVQICPATGSDCSQQSSLEFGEPFVIRLKEPIRFLSLFGYSHDFDFEAFGQVEPI